MLTQEEQMSTPIYREMSNAYGSGNTGPGFSSINFPVPPGEAQIIRPYTSGNMLNALSPPFQPGVPCTTINMPQNINTQYGQAPVVLPMASVMLLNPTYNFTLQISQEYQ